MPDRSKRRDDDTVRTILERASRRARSVSRRCMDAVRPGVRRPVPGTVERVDPERLKAIGEAPRDVERDDAFERGLAATIKGR